jgi:hypothetical protein
VAPSSRRLGLSSSQRELTLTASAGAAAEGGLIPSPPLSQRQKLRRSNSASERRLAFAGGAGAGAGAGAVAGRDVEPPSAAAAAALAGGFGSAYGDFVEEDGFDGDIMDSPRGGMPRGMSGRSSSIDGGHGSGSGSGGGGSGSGSGGGGSGSGGGGSGGGRWRRLSRFTAAGYALGEEHDFGAAALSPVTPSAASRAAQRDRFDNDFDNRFASTGASTRHVAPRRGMSIQTSGPGGGAVPGLGTLAGVTARSKQMLEYLERRRLGSKGSMGAAKASADGPAMQRVLNPMQVGLDTCYSDYIYSITLYSLSCSACCPRPRARATVGWGWTLLPPPRPLPWAVPCPHPPQPAKRP